MQLAELTSKKNFPRQVEIEGLALDSRQVQAGYLFAALKGERLDGTKFIDDAIKRGAVAVLTGPESEIRFKGAVHIADDNPRKAFAKMAAKYYGTQPATMAAVTGTNGKTSTTHFVRQMWQRLGVKAAAIGTLGVISEGINYSTGLTTPDPIKLHKALKQLAELEVTHVIMEVSSHGLVQYRVDGVDVKVAGFTNLTQDHMDYHADEENYYKAKARLFGEVLSVKGTAVLNTDNPFGMRLKDAMKIRGVRVISVGRKGADILLKRTTPEKGGQHIVFSYLGRDYETRFPVLGSFQAENVLLAAGIVIASGFAHEKVFKMFYYLAGVPGRMEKVTDAPNGAEVYIDYAHTPDGLSHALSSIRDHTFGKLHLVFGCGGERDTGKRPKMGAAAEALADYVYVTDDNPRNENPFEIRQAILKGCPSGMEFVDRGDAIRFGVRAMKPDDVLFITGKGNETGQIVGNQVLPFSDKEVVRETVAKMIEEQK
jgi:UDP-N-acetylmuramoyl-L-alanyl-D-glutamate--2,6-diaminopimelate ligase